MISTWNPSSKTIIGLISMVYRNNEKGTYLEIKYYFLISSCCLLFISIYIIILRVAWWIDLGGDFAQFYAASLMAANGSTAMARRSFGGSPETGPVRPGSARQRLEARPPAFSVPAGTP